eukprot:CAMPEP_0168341822 /NCGR_PEP_ID=MMETSP0213-20121227/14965_1 /TAXON_ID=151035 /ORGANISM="Euplotes harpa, Strain FSP1.4" /LENGTH=162 /DNA_ID=CAMNT_0008348477 /DNA_START=890 /DNA_END=1378 /DNA_ORIENTATION=-
MLKSVSEENGVIPVILLFLFLVIAIMHIPIIFFIGKEAVLIIFYNLTKKSPKAEIKIDNLFESQKSIPDEADSHSQHERQNEEHKDDELQYNENVQNVVIDRGTVHDAAPQSEQAPNPKEYLNMKPVYYYVITLCCYGIVVLLSIVVGDVKVFFGIIGSTAA